MNIQAILNNISDRITKEIDSPNRGGCAVIAAIVGSELQQYTDVEVLVQDWYYGTSSVYKAKRDHDTSSFNTAFDWNEVGVDFGHVLLKVKIDGEWKVFDSDGLVEFQPEDYGEGFTLDETIQVASSPRGWNTCFPRRQIPSIFDIVCNAFSIAKPTKLSADKFIIYDEDRQCSWF